MANPFRTFRKHQKWLLATLGIGAMIAFCVPMAVFQGSGGPSRANPVVVRTQKHGNLKERELAMMCERRNQMIRFLNRVQRAAIDNEGNPMAAQQFLDAIGPATEYAVVNTWLFAKEAKSQGMVVSDRTVNEFLKKLTDNSVNTPELKTILRNMGLSEPGLFDLLKYELSALRLQQMIQPSLPATLPRGLWGSATRVPLLHFQPKGAPPGQRWDYLTRLARQATIEVAPVKVEDFVDEVPDPGDETLREFFERHKENFARPDSPEPGFHEPHKIAVQYFKANAKEFQSREFVPDDEVYETYEQYKDFFDRLPAAAIAPPAGEGKSKDAGDKPAATGLQEKTTPSDGAPTAEKTGVEPKNDNTTPKPEKPKPEDSETKEESSDVPQPEQPDRSSSATPLSPFGFASYLQENGSEEEAGEKKDEAGEGKIGEEKTAKEPTLPSGPANSKKTDQPKEEKNAGDGDEKPDAAPEEPAAGPPKPSESKPPRAAKPKTREEILAGGIGDFIRVQLAPKKMEDVFNVLEEKMQKYRKLRNRYEIDQEKSKNAKPPEKLDFEALAEEHPGISAHQTPLISALESLKYDIAHSFLEGSQRHPFWVDAYIENRQLYLPERSVDRTGNQYLFWKNDDLEAKVPEFEDVRESVLRAWKTVEARQPAMDKANQLAEKARKAGGPLAKALAGEKLGGKPIAVTEAGPFSWMTVDRYAEMVGRTPLPEISKVEGVPMAGNDFMKTVFEMKPGDVGAAMNLPKNTAYVIRVREVNPSDNVLWVSFELDKYGKYSNVADRDIRGMINTYREEFAREAGLEWERQPDQRRR